MRLSFLFFLVLSIYTTYAQRSDFVASLATTSDTRGTWQSQVFCPSETYITNINQRQECEKYGTTDYKAACQDIQQIKTASIITPFASAYDKGDWQTAIGCAAGDLMNTFFVNKPTEGGKNKGLSNNIGVNDFNFKCILSDGYFSPGGACNNDVLSDQMTCSPGQAFCGFQVKFYANSADELGFTDVAMLCCLVCKKEEGYFVGETQNMNLPMPFCSMCPIYCKTCWGSSYNQCTSCFNGDVLKNEICVASDDYMEIGSFFTSNSFNNDHPDFMFFTSDKSPTLTSSCMEICWVGGYSIFGKDNYLSYALLVIRPHYKLRIKARFLKTDNWNGESIVIMVDGVKQVISNIANLGNNIGKVYFGNQCGGEFYAEDVINVDYTMAHSLNINILIKFTSTLVGAATQQSWAVRDIVFGVYKCDVSCVTCSGPESNKCLECYTSAELLNGVCTCNPGYYANSNPNCLYFPCMSCDACYVGCAVCSGPEEEKCQVCKTNYYRNSGKCVSECPIPLWGDPASMTCVTSCPLSNQYQSITKRTCEVCYITCLTCSDKIKCLTCSTDYYKQLQSSFCVKNCSPGYYENTVTKTCEFCDFNCMLCATTKYDCSLCSAPAIKTGNSCLLPANYIQAEEHLKLPTFSAIGFIPVPAVSDISKCIYLCGSFKIFGGPNCIYSGSSIEKSHYNLVPHYQIRMTFSVLKIDIWKNKQFTVKIDETIVSTRTFIETNDPNNFLCGKSDSPESLRNVVIAAKHESTSVTIKLVTTLDSSDAGSWGITDYTFYVAKCHETCLTCNEIYSPLNCTLCGSNALLVEGSCQCLPGYVHFLDSICSMRPCYPCVPCNSECKTCSGTLSTQCLSCETPRFLYLTNCVTKCPAPLVGVRALALCSTSCPNAGDVLDENRICTVCHVDCLSCNGEGSENCILCRKIGLTVLLKDGKSLCISDCGERYYQLLNNCIQCEEKCNKCDIQGCLECQSPSISIGGKCIFTCGRDSNQNQLYFNNATETCEKDCPLGTYPNQEANFCWACASRCSKCTGLLVNECYACFEGFYLFNNGCVDFCKPGYFVNSKKNSCEKCLPKCYRCNDEKSCEECEKGLYIMRPNNDTCVTCDSNGNFQEEGVCLVCATNCMVCEGASTCQVCLSNYYLSQGQCLIQKIIKAELKYDELNLFRFHLKFSSYWKYGFESLPLKIQIKILDLSSQFYSYHILKNETDLQDFLLDFDYKVNITLGMKLKVKLDLPTQDEYNLNVNEYELALKEYYQCPDENIYNATSKSCYQKIPIIPVLEYGANLDELKLRLEPEFDLLLSVIPNNTIVSIAGINFTHNFISDGKSYIIKFNFNQSFMNKPVCTIFITTPSIILFNSSNSRILDINTVSISMRNYYVLDNAVKNTIENAKKTTEQMNSISSTATMSNSLISFGSTMAISIMMSMEIIRFLKYLEIDYPPYVEEMFKSSLRGSGIIPDVFIDIDPSETARLPYQFAKYNNSIYVFNNNGNFLIENVFYFGIGLLFLVLENQISKKYQNRLINKVTELLAFMFAWNFVITYFLGVFLNYIFFNILFFKFPAMNSVSGKLNMFYATSEFLLILIALLYFAKIIKNFHNVQKHQEISIFPDQDSLSISNNSSKSELFSPDKLKRGTSVKDFYNNKTNNVKVINMEVIPNEREHLNRTSNFSAILPKKQSLFQRTKTAYNKLADTIGVPSKVMGKVVNNFFGNTNQNIVHNGKSDYLSSKTEMNNSQKRFGCLNKGLNHMTKGQSFYLLFDVLRQTIISFMIVFLYDNPITAMVIVNFANLNFFVLIAFIRPQKERLDQIQTVINELCVNLACFGAMALAIMERTGNDDPALKLNVGWIIVAANMTFMAVFLGRFFLTITVMIGKQLIELYKNRKLKRNKVVPQEIFEEAMGSADMIRTPEVIKFELNEKNAN